MSLRHTETFFFQSGHFEHLERPGCFCVLSVGSRRGMEAGKCYLDVLSVGCHKLHNNI